MALPTFAPPVAPSPGTAHAPRVSLWEADFGDGYSQPTPKGINHIRKSVALSWDALNLADMRTIVGFFEDRAGCLPFKFKPFGEPASIKWTCKEWTNTAEAGVWKVTANLSQSFTTET